MLSLNRSLKKAQNNETTNINENDEIMKYELVRQTVLTNKDEAVKLNLDTLAREGVLCWLKSIDQMGADQLSSRLDQNNSNYKIEQSTVPEKHELVSILSSVLMSNKVGEAYGFYIK